MFWIFFSISFSHIFFRPVKYEYAVYVSMNIFHTLEAFIFFFFIYQDWYS